MASHKSALKRIKQTENRTEINRGASHPASPPDAQTARGH